MKHRKNDDEHPHPAQESNLLGTRQRRSRDVARDQTYEWEDVHHERGAQVP